MWWQISKKVLCLMLLLFLFFYTSHKTKVYNFWMIKMDLFSVHFAKNVGQHFHLSFREKSFKDIRACEDYTIKWNYRGKVVIEVTWRRLFLARWTLFCPSITKKNHALSVATIFVPRIRLTFVTFYKEQRAQKRDLKCAWKMT